MERDKMTAEEEAAAIEQLSKELPLPAAVEGLVLAIRQFQTSIFAAERVPGFAPDLHDPLEFRTAQVLAELLEEDLDEWLAYRDAIGSPADA
jgi:hypothetical protein